MNNSEHLAWVDQREERHDHISRNLVSRIAATLGKHAPSHGQALPPLWHWCFFQPAVDPSGLGLDGHPSRGGFLPPAQNRNRMWAGGRVEFIAPLQVGADATRISTITSIKEKQGQSGALLFVTVQHEIIQDGRLAIREEQDIVYREPTPPKLSSSEALPRGQWAEQIHPDPVLLFRYSAVSFNAHRIHYDYPYAVASEGYPNLVVHGPLIATLSLQAFCRANPQLQLRHYQYRSLRPLFCHTPFEVGGQLLDNGRAQLWAGDGKGIAQKADIQFD